MAGAIADGGGIGTALAAERERAGGVLEGAVIGRLVQDGRPGCARGARASSARGSGQACASLGVVLDPQLFVIGGGVADAGDRLLEPVRQAYLDHLPARGFHPEPVFAVAELGNEAGVVGAADLARLHEDPTSSPTRPAAEPAAGARRGCPRPGILDGLCARARKGARGCSTGS